MRRRVFHSRDIPGGGQSIGGGGQQHGKCRYETNIHLFVCQHAGSDCYYHLMPSSRRRFQRRPYAALRLIGRGWNLPCTSSAPAPVVPGFESASQSKLLKMRDLLLTTRVLEAL